MDIPRRLAASDGLKSWAVEFSNHLAASDRQPYGGCRKGKVKPSGHVRAAEFPGDNPEIMDFPRSGSVEGIAGKVALEVLAAKMANTIAQNKELQATYLPNQVSVVRRADVARVEGRRRLRGGNKARPEKLKRKLEKVETQERDGRAKCLILWRERRGSNPRPLA